jgi:DNA-binding transcriptional MerR regulator
MFLNSLYILLKILGNSPEHAPSEALRGRDDADFVKTDGTTQSAHGRYRIQTVAELTGVPASTLRAWEQRYGFPSPERTASAYRLYTDADVARIVRVRALCDSGMAAAEAVAAVMREAGTTAPPIDASATSIVPRDMITRVTAPPSVDVLGLDAALRGALLIAPPAIALAQSIAPQWQRMREAWLAGRLDRAEHRIVVETFGHVARDLMRMGQPGQPIGVALLGSLGDDDDVMPLCAAAVACHARQIRTLLLGGRTTAGSLADGVRRFAPRLVVLACVEAPASGRARELLDDAWRSVAGVPLLVCGPGAASLPALDRPGLRVIVDPEALAVAIDEACDQP